MHTDTNSGNPNPPEQIAHGQTDCGNDAEQAALHEIEAAKVDLAKSDQEIKKGLHDMDEAQHELQKAEADLEEARRHHVIHFSVDGEPFETKQVEWTPNDIIRKFGERDPATNYLVEIEGRHKVSFQGKGDIAIKLHDCERFQIISIGPTPVSDGTTCTGVEFFIAGLKTLGYSPTVLTGKRDHVVIDYKVESGTRAEQRVRLGFVVPADFPMTPPGGIHVSPSIHPRKDGGDHPTGGILNSDFNAADGGDWQYWSRPFKEWGKAKKTVASYMSYVWRLWDSQ